MVDATKQIGAELANVAYNWAQSPGRILTLQDCEMLKELSERWDAAAKAPKPKVSCGNFVTVVLEENAARGIPTQGTRLFDGNGTQLSGVTLVSIEGAVDALWKVKLEAFVQIKRPSEL